MQTDLQDLRQRALEEYAEDKRRRRQHYQLARSLGFSAREAKILAGHSESSIRDLAAQQQADQAQA